MILISEVSSPMNTGFETAPRDDSCILVGPNNLKVYVSRTSTPQPHLNEVERPAGKPPEVHFHGVVCNYWMVLDRSSIPILADEKRLDNDQIRWLRSIKEVVEEMIEANG